MCPRGTARRIGLFDAAYGAVVEGFLGMCEVDVGGGGDEADGGDAAAEGAAGGFAGGDGGGGHGIGVGGVEGVEGVALVLMCGTGGFRNCPAE